MNIISFFISLIIFIIIIFFLKRLSLISNQKIPNNNLQVENTVCNTTKKDIQLEDIKIWQISIEKLNMQAEIKEGVSEDIIKENVGHFTTSSLLYGNVSLKAYNTGKNKNHFANLKELEIGDEIKYILNDDKYIYQVKQNIIIEENDENEYTSKNAEKNKITLITYIKDMPNKRRCVIAENVREDIVEK